MDHPLQGDFTRRRTVRSVLLIAYHFPPILGSSGVHRTLQFARHLPSFGWNPVVLTVHPRAYPSWHRDLFREVPNSVLVARANAWDTARHFAWKGRYPGILAVPDRWVTWWMPGVMAGLRMIRRHRPQLIWTTFPVATAHLIGLTLHRLTKLPWVADFRDPMVQPGLPESALGRGSWQWLERWTVGHADRCCVTTPSTLLDMRRRYPAKSEESWVLIENGYDESLFPASGNRRRRIPAADGPITLLHSGILYSQGRNPVPFFKALRKLLADLPIELRVLLRGAGDEVDFDPLLAEYGLRNVVKVLPTIGYAEATHEMMAADGLLLFQGRRYNRQIPAKAYEYIRAGRPILALVDKEGDTMHMLQSWSHVYPAAPNSVEGIHAALKSWLHDLENAEVPSRPAETVARLSRRFRTEQLAITFNRIMND